MAGKQRFIDSDMAAVYEMVTDAKTGKQKKERLTTLCWGDSVRVLGTSSRCSARP